MNIYQCIYYVDEYSFDLFVALPGALGDVTAKLGEGPSAVISSVQEKCSLMWHVAIWHYYNLLCEL